MAVRITDTPQQSRTRRTGPGLVLLGAWFALFLIGAAIGAALYASSMVPPAVLP
ncbi:hypothetical protein [Amycolatopsis taiwanensis]|uniref:hypothetical protein n=1 Tax=Amycolatopsis taiwanensis TaxID=342230 RepID=UPI0004B90E73|nr:hypothetical protein [Amycolatopsis taiwanensis]